MQGLIKETVLQNAKTNSHRCYFSLPSSLVFISCTGMQGMHKKCASAGL